MIKNYLKIAFRNFKRRIGYTSINIFGLAIGLACCFLIFQFVRLEMNYDTFHEKSERTFRIVTNITQSGNTRELAWSSPPLAEALVNNFPEVEQAVRIHRPSGTMRRGDENEVVEVSFVDSTFFNVFDFKLESGIEAYALQKPGSVVISKAQADRFFKDEDPLNKTLIYADTLELKVTGILEDIPQNSHYQPEYIANIRTLSNNRFQSWQGMNLWTYLVLNKQTLSTDFESKLPGFIGERLGKAWSQIMTLHLQPLTSIYFESNRLPEIGPTGDRSYVYIFSGIGFFILIIACINFINLSTAQSYRRAREVGIRKTLGVYRSQLIRQFLGESIVLVLISMVLALVIAHLAIPAFEQLTSYELTTVKFLDPVLILTAVGIAILLGIVAGFYPAFILSLFKPSAVLSGNVSIGYSNMKIQSSNSLLRQGLVAIQFIISIFLIICTIVINNQLEYIQNRNLGFNKDQLVVLRLSNQLQNGYDPLKQNLLRQTSILQVGASSSVPGLPIGPRGYIPEGVTEGELLTNTLWVDEEFLNVMDIDLLEGQGFSLKRPSELQNGFLINEAAVGHFGWSGAKQAMNKMLRAPGQTNVEGYIIGVVENFNYESLYNPIQPLVLRYRDTQPLLSLRIQGDKITEAMDHIEMEWNAVASDEPLVSWFLDDQLRNMYETEIRMESLFRYFSVLALIIACLGLYGLASFSIQKRTKEIGIRKVLGATISRIMFLISKEYIKLVIIAAIVACPVGYIIMNRWLGNFIYKTGIPIWIYLLAFGVVLLLAIFTVSYHSLKAASLNPVDSLRSE